MCVIPQETPCSNDRINMGHSGKGIFEGKNIETPNTAPDAFADLTFLHNSGNAYHQILHTTTTRTTTSTNTDATLQVSTKPPYDHSTNDQIILAGVITYQVKFLTLSLCKACKHMLMMVSYKSRQTTSVPLRQCKIP
jgi:hypothetical protein